MLRTVVVLLPLLAGAFGEEYLICWGCRMFFLPRRRCVPVAESDAENVFDNRRVLPSTDDIRRRLHTRVYQWQTGSDAVRTRQRQVDASIDRRGDRRLSGAHAWNIRLPVIFVST